MPLTIKESCDTPKIHHGVSSNKQINEHVVKHPDLQDLFEEQINFLFKPLNSKHRRTFKLNFVFIPFPRQLQGS